MLLTVDGTGFVVLGFDNQFIGGFTEDFKGVFEGKSGHMI
jgi:hypothetical protein